MASFEWIDADDRLRLTFRARPRAPIGQDLATWRAAGVDRVVSLQTEPEAARMGLEDESRVAQTLGIAFDRFAIEDHDVPDDDERALAFAKTTLTHLQGGQSVLLHCYAGIGRSGLMAILILMTAGYGRTDAAHRASAARGFRVPENSLQRRWLDRIAERLGVDP